MEIGESMLPGLEKAIWQKDGKGRMLPIAKPQDDEPSVRRGERCRGWGKGWSKDEIGPKRKTR